MGGVELARITAADQPELVRLAQAFHAEHGHPLGERSHTGLALVAQGHPLAQGWLVRADGRPVGYAVLALGFAIDHGGPIATLDDLYLVPQARRRGIGAKIMAHLETQARAMGLSALLVVTESGNTPAIGLYRRHGLAEWHGLLMAKTL